MKLLKLLSLAGFIGLALASCDNPAPAKPKLIFKFKFDSTQVRLDNLGNPAVMPPNHRGQSPNFNLMSCHYIELAPGMFTALGTGAKLYIADTAATGAIDFNSSVKVDEGETFFSMNIEDIPEGTYEWLRMSLAYQNYDINYKVGPPAFPTDVYGVGTVASFIGYRTYISSYTINTQTVNVNGDRLQGYWGFETAGTTTTGQAPPGSTTVPNPLFASSPIPAGSCVVTAAFSTPLVISHSATSDITIEVALSTNKSFEWIESGGNNLYEPLNGDTVIDMGIRGMIPTVIQ
jgi:hypothetical protein